MSAITSKDFIAIFRELRFGEGMLSRIEQVKATYGPIEQWDLSMVPEHMLQDMLRHIESSQITVIMDSNPNSEMIDAVGRALVKLWAICLDALKAQVAAR